MTNHENYKNAVSSIEPSRDFAERVLKEAEKMDMHTNKANGNMSVRRRRSARPFAVICAAVVLILALAAVSYATDIAGFRQGVDTWLYGEPV